MNRPQQAAWWRRRYRCSVKLALGLFAVAVISDFGGLGCSLSMDFTAHGVISICFGIISLYLYQDAVVNKKFSRDVHALAYVVLFGFLWLVLSTISNCLCEIGTMKSKMVFYTVPVIGLMMWVRIRWPENKKKNETQES